ncbi:hypothetical protein ACFVQ4_16635 [Streptomyces laurentii]|uniref:hypothetical protein n=1 Tax=Streptomyces laurentii TaxID=39478 RepID=UPI00369F4F45
MAADFSGAGEFGPAPVARTWLSAFTTLGLAMWTATAGMTVPALSSANSAVTLFFILHAALDA